MLVARVLIQVHISSMYSVRLGSITHDYVLSLCWHVAHFRVCWSTLVFVALNSMYIYLGICLLLWIYCVFELHSWTFKITELHGKHAGTMGCHCLQFSQAQDFLFEIAPDGDLMPSFSVKPFKPRIYETRSWATRHRNWWGAANSRKRSLYFISWE